MPERELHCPFLNRSDTRCANHFSLDTLGDAFDDCFGQYHGCETYRELLAERRELRGEPSAAFALASHGREPADVRLPYVQLRVAHHHAGHAPAA